MRLLDGRVNKEVPIPGVREECRLHYRASMWQRDEDAYKLPNPEYIKKRLVGQKLPKYNVLDIEHLDDNPDMVVKILRIFKEIRPDVTVEVARWSGWRSLDGQGGGR